MSALNQYMSLEERFWARVDRRGDDECWTWTGVTIRDYGSIKTNGVRTGAHRVSWELFHGKKLGPLAIDHLCLNKKCVNPRHLEAVTAAENTKRWADNILYCKRGHAFDHCNTYTDTKGRRQCRACRAEFQRELRRRRRESK